MTSEVEERPRLVTAGYGRHRGQWIKLSHSTKQINLRDQRTDTELSSPRNIAHSQAPDYINDLLSLKTESNSLLVLTVSFASSQSQLLHIWGSRLHPR